MAYVDLSDSELEQWFSRHRLELANLTSLDMAPIAAWLYVIGPPANDNIESTGQLYLVPEGLSAAALPSN